MEPVVIKAIKEFMEQSMLRHINLSQGMKFQFMRY